MLPFAAWPPPALMRMPSTKMIGSFDCESEALPRMRIFVPSPVRPPDGRPTIPGSRPCRMFDTSVIGMSSGGRTTAIVLPSFLTSVACPDPVTTTWSSWRVDCCRLKSTRTTWSGTRFAARVTCV